MLWSKFVEDTYENTQWRKAKQMQPVWLCMLWSKFVEDTFDNSQWRKVKQMQAMWLCLFSGRQFEDTFENAQWRKVKQMQPMWLCLFSGRRFEDTFENAQWRKTKQMQPVWLCLLWPKFFEETYEKAQWGKVKQMKGHNVEGRKVTTEKRTRIKAQNSKLWNRCQQLHLWTGKIIRQWGHKLGIGGVNNSVVTNFLSEGGGKHKTNSPKKWNWICRQLCHFRDFQKSQQSI